jgi:uncharacterized protein
MEMEEEKYGAAGQWLVCGIFAVIGLLLMHFVQHAELPRSLATGMAWPLQLAAGTLVGLAVGATSLYSAWFHPRTGIVKRTAASYSRLDLGGLNPVWISLAAGIGEELLFRAALQPLLGIWLTSLLFLIVHTRAYEFRLTDKVSWIQAASVFGMSIGLGLLYEHVGLLSAVIAHVVVDVCALYAVRLALHRR